MPFALSLSKGAKNRSTSTPPGVARRCWF